MEIKYHPEVLRSDIPRLDTEIRKRISSAIERKLATNPGLYGLPLRSPLHHLWKLRVGDYRVVYLIERNTVKVVIIAHRKNIYEMVKSRI